MTSSPIKNSQPRRKARNGIFVASLLLALGAILYAYLQYNVTREFQVPIAYTMVGDRLYVLEKEENTILELEYLSPTRPLELRGRYQIEEDDAEHYYMVRKLYPGPEGVVVNSYIYGKKAENFIGYRFREYRSFRDPPREIFAIELKYPDKVPEINYARGGDGRHYFVNNCAGKRDVWIVPPAGRASMSGGDLPAEVRALGEINDDFSNWEGICVGPGGDIFLSSGATGKIVQYSPEGRKEQEIGRVGKKEGELLAPAENFFVALSHDLPRSLTVASTGNRTWVQFTPEGEVLLTVAPLKEGYQDHYRDILVGPIFATEPAGEVFSFDLVNRCFVILSRDFSVVTTYRMKQPGLAALFLGLAVFFSLGAVFSRKLAAGAARLRFPFFVKLLLLFVPVLVASAMVIGYEVKKIMKEDLEAEYIRRAANLAAAIMNAVPPADLERLREVEAREKPLYQEVSEKITRIVNRKDVDYTPKWIIHLVDDQGRYFFGINIWRGAIYEPFIVPDERKMFRDVLKSKTPQYGRFTDEQGEWFSYLCPIKNDEGKVINVIELYRPTEELDRADRRAAALIKERVGETVLIAVLLVLLFSYIFTRPLRKLIQGIKVVSKGDFDHKIIVRSRDEISRLAGTFNQMVLDLKQYTRDLARTTAEKERYETELKVAHQVQQGILPKTFPPYPEVPSVEIFARMKPAREIGGDYYDFFLVDRDHLGVVVADVSGKGMPAGLFMMVVRTLLRNNAWNNLSAAATIAKTNRMIAADNPSVLFVTIFYLICDLKSGEIIFCNAGHNPPVVMKKNGISFLSSGEEAGKGMAIGIMEDAEYSDASLILDEGESLVLYTDGATEAFDLDNRMFGEERLIQCIEENSSLPSREIWDRLYQALSKFQAGREQFDDITVLFLKYLGTV